MSGFTPTSQLPVASADLPLTIISLEDWVLVSVQGAESTHYLQGQLTLDLTTLTQDKHQICAHCDAKGKMWSTVRLFRHDISAAEVGYAYIERRSLSEKQVTELKKYAVFSKVKIEIDNNALLVGIAGFQARIALNKAFTRLPDENIPVVREGDTTILWFRDPTERFLIVTTRAIGESLKLRLSDKAEIVGSQQWIALDIEAGLPIIDHLTSALFIPQAVNLQALDGISFKKGCYTGQETVARAKFRGANKRALYWLAGETDAMPSIAEPLEMRIGANWRSTGTVLAAVQLNNGKLWVQAVLNLELELDTVFRIQKVENAHLTLEALPYKLNQD